MPRMEARLTMPMSKICMLSVNCLYLSQCLRRCGWIYLSISSCAGLSPIQCVADGPLTASFRFID